MLKRWVERAVSEMMEQTYSLLARHEEQIDRLEERADQQMEVLKRHHARLEAGQKQMASHAEAIGRAQKTEIDARMAELNMRKRPANAGTLAEHVARVREFNGWVAEEQRLRSRAEHAEHQNERLHVQLKDAKIAITQLTKSVEELEAERDRLVVCGDAASKAAEKELADARMKQQLAEKHAKEMFERARSAELEVFKLRKASLTAKIPLRTWEEALQQPGFTINFPTHWYQTTSTKLCGDDSVSNEIKTR